MIASIGDTATELFSRSMANSVLNIWTVNYIEEKITKPLLAGWMKDISSVIDIPLIAQQLLTANSGAFRAKVRKAPKKEERAKMVSDLIEAVFRRLGITEEIIPSQRIISEVNSLKII